MKINKMEMVIAELQNLTTVFALMGETIVKLPDMLAAKNKQLSEYGDTETETQQEREDIAKLVSLTHSLAALHDQMVSRLTGKKLLPLNHHEDSASEEGKVVSELQNLAKIFAPIGELIKKLPAMFAAKNVKLLTYGDSGAETELERERIARLVNLNHSMKVIHDQMLSALAAERLLPLKHHETPPSGIPMMPTPITTVVSTTTTSTFPAANAGEPNGANSEAINKEAIMGTTSAQPGTTNDGEVADITVN